MLTGIHILLTYDCNLECDHCFLYCGPNKNGTFTLKQLRQLFKEIEKIGTIDNVYFEGGEPFLYYPLMLEGMRMANAIGIKSGIVTNAYFATTVEDAILWLKPIAEIKVSDLSVSDDPFHYDKKDSPAKIATEAAKSLGIPINSICIEKPTVENGILKGQDKGTPVVGGGAMFRGRVVEKLIAGLPKKRWEELTKCPYEDLENPKRVHIDCFGNVHICQGLSMDNMCKTPLHTLVKNYDGLSHPICEPLIKGGPALLAREYNLEHDASYVDECHFCYLMRLALIDRFPLYLAPRRGYGLE